MIPSGITAPPVILRGSHLKRGVPLKKGGLIMTLKHVDYDTLCGVPLNIQPEAWEELVKTDAFSFRVLAYPLIDEDSFVPAYSDKARVHGTSPALLLSLNLYRSEHQYSLDETMRQLHFSQECQLFTNTLGMCRTDMPESDRILSRFENRAKDYAEATGATNPIDLNYRKLTVACCALTGADLNVLRSDSTPVSGNFKIRTGEELVYVAINSGVDYLNTYGSDEQKAAIREGRLNKYNDIVFSENAFTYHWAASTEEKRETLCKDADAFFDILTPKDKEDCSISRFVRAINEHTVVGDDSNRTFRAKGDPELKKELIQSFQDLDANYRIKDKKSLWGYMLNIQEERNQLTHIIINSMLRPNRTQDSDMEKEAYAELPEFVSELDDFYAQYPALIKGDPLACQRVVMDVLNTLENDFLHEADTLYKMIQSHCADEMVRSQQRKTLAILDSFYPRLKDHAPMPSESLLPSEENPAVSSVGESAPTQSASDICHRTMTDWGHTGEDTITWDDPSFSQLSDGLRRNFYLGKIAEKPENSFTLPVGQHASISDAGYSPAAKEAKGTGYTLFTTNLLGNKANPVIALFGQKGDEYVTCPKGNPVEKQSVRSNGTVCVWVEKSYCSQCPCAADCKAKPQKRGDLAAILIQPHAIPAIISEAKATTDDFQCLGDIRNGTECDMSLFRNFYHCDQWPIGMATKTRLSKDMIMSSNLRNLFLALRGKSRVHPNKLFGENTGQKATAKGVDVVA